MTKKRPAARKAKTKRPITRAAAKPKQAPLIDAHELVAAAAAPAAPEPATPIADLLIASHAAHQEYRNAVPRRVPGGSATPGDAAVARDALARAYDARLQAHALDPEHLDSAWQAEALAYPHDALMTFYAGELAK